MSRCLSRPADPCQSRRRGFDSRLAVLATTLLLGLGAAVPANAGLALGVQGMLADECGGARFEQLADYLSVRMGEAVRLSVVADTREFRAALAAGQLDAVIATDHYLSNTGLDVMVDTVASSRTPRTYQLLVRQDSDVHDAKQLVGRQVAGESAPSQAAQNFVELFPNPIRQPEYRATRDAREAWRLLADGSVQAVLVPTRAGVCARAVTVIQQRATELLVRIAVRKDFAESRRQSLREALHSVGNFAAGLAALDASALMGFDVATVPMSAKLAD